MSTTQGKSVMVQGRVVWVSGDLFKGKQKVDQNTKRPITRDDGSPVMEYGFGLAVPKSVLNQMGSGQPGEIWAVMHQEAQSLYPTGQVPPNFAFKYKDGDGIDDKGQPFANREGYAGHLVFACTTTLPIKYYRFDDQLKQNVQIDTGIKCGDYVNVQLHIKAHPPKQANQKPGLYLNPNAVQFLYFGKEIINAPSGDSIFGAIAPVIPQGASNVMPPAQPGFLVGAPQAVPVQQWGQSVAPAPQMPPAVQQAPIQPHFGVLPQAHQAQFVPQAAPQMPGVPGMPQFGQ